MIAMISGCCLLFLQSATATTATARTTMHQHQQQAASCCWQFRSATLEDVAFARKTMMQQAMNPLSISKERLLVAFDDDDENENAAATSTSTSSSSSSNNNSVGSKERLLGFGQIRPLDDLHSELASLYVLPNQRGKGVGGSLIQELLSRHDNDDNDSAAEPGSKKIGEPVDDTPVVVLLLTLRPTMPLYEKYGFEEIVKDEMSEIMPLSLQLEYKAGSIVSAFLGNDLVCMKRTVK